MDILEVKEGLLHQTSDEILVYTITTTNWASSPSSSAVKVYDEADGTDVTTTVMPTNSPTINGDVITLSPLKLLTAGNEYRVEVKFVSGVNTWECFFRVRCDY